MYHVKLTDSALRALEAFQNIKGSLQCEPSICFKGSQGYIKIPAPTPDAPSALRVFAFYLSTDSKDQPQASFDCIHQYVSRDGHEQLEGQGIIQDKITVCATDDSYQTTRERMSQVEKDSWNRSVIEIKPGHPGWSSKFPKRNVQSLPTTDSSPLKQSVPNRRVSGGAGLNARPLRERIVHLLALKPYRKPELLLWLEKERASPKDKAELSAVLEEVAKLNPKDSSYCLQDNLYKNVQKDWLGYSEEEKQLIGRVLARKLPNSCQTRNPQATPSVQKSPVNTTQHQSPKKNPNMKRPGPVDSKEKIEAKRQKLLTKRLEPAPHDLNTSSLLPSFQTNTEFQRTCNLTGNQNNSSEPSNSIPHTHRLSSTSVVSETVKQDSKISSSLWTQAHSACTKEQPPNHQHKKKKSKKHKDRERERLKDTQDSEWLETSPDLKQNLDKLDNPGITKGVESEDKPDYILVYSTILNLEQRQRYQADFCAEYDEYKELHSRIATITHMFVQLGAKIKNLSPGTKDYKIMEDQIMEKYSKYKKKFPGYREEKKRCEYLHEKLSYIKQLITDYDVSQAS